MSEPPNNYSTIAAKKREQRQKKIPQDWLLTKDYNGISNFMDIPSTCGILSDVECDITSNHDATALLEKMKNGEWSAEQVTTAFCKRAAIAQQLVRKTVSNTKISSQQLIFPLDKLPHRNLLRRSNPASP